MKTKLHRTQVTVAVTKWVPTKHGHSTRPNGSKSGEATLFVNLERLAQRLGEQALRNKSGKARLAGGLIEVRVDGVTHTEDGGL